MESNAETKRLAEEAHQPRTWSRWGPYLSERQWGTVREDYSPHGTAWEYLPHDHARSRAYRWGEDGLAGISDDQQFLCHALAQWNGQDPILKERLFGLTNSEGNHGEDVKEVYYYLDAIPTHSYLKMLYKYPQREFPYAQLVEENRRRGKEQPEFELLDTGIFDDDRYFDVFVEYAKAGPEDTDFSLDEFRLDLLRYLEANRAELEEAGNGLYAVVPTKEDLFVKARPGAIFLLRHKSGKTAPPATKSTDSSKLNPLGPHYLVYLHDDGTVRFSFAQPKECMLLLRDLAAGEPSAFEKLCDLFDQHTRDGADMTLYSNLLQKALASIEHTFQRRAATSLLSGRHAVLPTAREAPTAAGDDFDLVTWLVIMDHRDQSTKGDR